MKFTVVFSILAAGGLAFGQANTVSFDQTFDNAAGSLNTVSCSNGPNGLENLGFTTFGSLPNFPFIGGAPAVTGFGSAACGTCWALTFNGKTINVLAIDHSTSFNIALEAMNVLTNNQAEFLGRVTVTSKQVDASECGL
ncbi:SnodProt1 [Schizopora paradoxa]|uniref:SnodProt1 n=1 Tax=Schizopora paradoxa TaxID=27342 RepID=A0A0H2RLU2_9AGAM|nr:SnodProt1 [Schizopora paradoxa]